MTINITNMDTHAKLQFEWNKFIALYDNPCFTQEFADVADSLIRKGIYIFLYKILSYEKKYHWHEVWLSDIMLVYGFMQC